MKKHLMIFGLVLQMILLCLPACAEKHQENEAWSYMPKEAYAAPAYLLVGQDNLFCVNPHMGMVLNWEGRMNTLSYNTQELEEDGISSGVLSEQDDVYVGIANDGTTLLKRNLSTMTPLAEGVMPAGIKAERAFLFDDQVVLLGNEQLWHISLSTFDQVMPLTCQGLPAEGVISMAALEQHLAVMYKNGTLCVLRADETGFVLEAVQTFDEPLTAIMMNKDYPRYGYVYGAIDDSNTVWCYHLRDGWVEQVEQLKWPAPMQQVWYIDGGLYIQGQDQSLYRFKNFDGGSFHSFHGDEVYTDSLNIQIDMIDVVSGNSFYAVEKFHDKYPNTAIIYNGMGNIMGNATAIQAGTYDLLAFSDESHSLATLVESGAIQPIDDILCIQEAQQEIIDLSSLCSWQGKQYIIPLEVKLHTWEVNPSLFEMVGIPMPENGWTVDDFFAIGQQLAQYNLQNGTHYVLLQDHMDAGLPYLLKQSLVNHFDMASGKLTLNKEHFLQLTEKYLTLRQEGLILEKTSLQEIPEISQKIDANCLFRTCAVQNYMELMNCTLIIPPVEDENTRFLADVAGLALGTNATLTDEAAYYMACQLAPENVMSTQAYHLGPLLKNRSLWLRYKSCSRNMAPREVEEVWQAMAQNATWNSLSADAEYALKYDLYPYVRDGKISTEAFVNQMMRMLRMMLME